MTPRPARTAASRAASSAPGRRPVGDRGRQLEPVRRDDERHPGALGGRRTVATANATSSCQPSGRSPGTVNVASPTCRSPMVRGSTQRSDCSRSTPAAVLQLEVQPHRLAVRHVHRDRAPADPSAGPRRVAGPAATGRPAPRRARRGPTPRCGPGRRAPRARPRPTPGVRRRAARASPRSRSRPRAPSPARPARAWGRRRTGPARRQTGARSSRDECAARAKWTGSRCAEHVASRSASRGASRSGRDDARDALVAVGLEVGRPARVGAAGAQDPPGRAGGLLRRA